jgi:hypothetical protein
MATGLEMPEFEHSPAQLKSAVEAQKLLSVSLKGSVGEALQFYKYETYNFSERRSLMNPEQQIREHAWCMWERQNLAREAENARRRGAGDEALDLTGAAFRLWQKMRAIERCLRGCPGQARA